MDSPVIQVRLKGRVMQTLSFQGDVLRIGRMKENDVVINNISVSRFHALLKRENGRVILEDVGSRSGCHVNGTRIASSIALKPDDEVLIGKYQLVLSEGGAQEASSPEAAARGKSDAWDASSTYFAGAEVQAKVLEGSGSPAPSAASMDQQEDLFPPAEPEAAAVEMVEPPEPATAEIQSPGEPTWYAGLIIQREGKLDRVISWDRDQLTAGRSRECEIFLDHPEISRRHAVFVREAGGYEVRDLESSNGVLVNGEKAKRRCLEVGDTVKIEGFELVFVLDRRSIDDQIETDELATPVAAGAEGGFDMTMLSENLPIGSDITNPRVVEQLPALVEVAEQMSEDDLSGLDDAGDKEIVEVEAVSPPPVEVEDSAVPVVTDDVLTLELRVRVEDLPEPLRAALADVDGCDLRLPAEIVFKTDA